MNKTVTINISGIIFHIEEDAYETLSSYLSKIKVLFANTEGGLEIMGDIEARIAELLQATLGTAKQVIVMADVESVIAVMGRPEDFGSEQKQEEGPKASDEKQSFQQEKIKKRLFRNPDDKAIGGVCSGLAAYFDIDTVWVRLAMFLLIFFGGVSLWVYIVLWIIMPEAKTTADKLQMRGEAANINSIFRSFKEEAEDVKNRYTKTSYGATVRNNATVVLATIFGIIGRLFGLFLVIIGCTLLFFYAASLFGITVADGNTNLTHWRSATFASSSDYFLAVFAFIIVAGIPVMMMVYAGVKLLFKIRYSNRWLNISLGVIWIIGIIVGLYVTASTVKQFNETARLKDTYQLRNLGDTIVIRLNAGSNTLKDLSFENKDDVEHYLSNNHSWYCFGENNHRLSLIGYAELNVSESYNDSVELVVTRKANGRDKREANENARTIRYSYRQDGSQLIFDEIFSAAEDTRFRAQQVEIKLRVPKGKVVYFDRSVKYLLDHIDNTTNTWDGNMVGRRWIMTGRGLQCIDCDGLEDMEEWHHPRHGRHSDEITINEEGIHVNGSEAKVRIDEHGIRIKTPEKEIRVGEDGKVERDREESED